MLTVTLPQARQFILLKQGLLGDYRFIRKDGAYQYVRQAGCIQFDPVDVCGRNAELTLQSRVKGFRKKMLHDLLYRDRLLVDYSDKELSIWPSEDWPFFSGYRERSKALGRTFAGIPELEDIILSEVPDTLISREEDADTALKVSMMTRDLLKLKDESDFSQRLAEFDDYLFDNGYNPGTTADLTAASIFVSNLKDHF